MRAVLLSDAHLDGADDPAVERFVAWIDRLDCDLLCVLGDLFHVWWDFGTGPPPESVCVLESLGRARSRGVAIVFVPGNHDFAAAPYFRDRLGAEVPGVHVRDLDGLRCVLAHGDEADESTTYRVARRVLRSGAFDLALRAAGPSAGARLLRRLAGASRTHPANPALLVARQRAWAQERLREGAHAVVLGHSHAPGETTLEGGRLFNLGSWSEHGTWLDVRDGTPTLVQEPSSTS